MKKNNIVISEFGTISKHKLETLNDKYFSAHIQEKPFNELIEFAKTEKGNEVFDIRKNGHNDILKAKNYVGIIQTISGLTVEILPKIYYEKENNNDKDYTRKTFIKMLKKIKNLPDYKNLNFANLKTTNMRLIEIFISMFINEIYDLISKGIKSKYSNKVSNEKFLKGKLLQTVNIRRNYLTKTRFFIEYDEYLPDIPENRIIKHTILFLKKIASSNNNLKELQRLTLIFQEISKVINIDKDLNKCSLDRTMHYYENALIWCKLFLKNKSFTSYKGSTIAFALLFPMEQIFEKYVLYHLKNMNICRSINKRRGLFLEGLKDNFLEFNCFPDMAGLSNGKNEYYIFDAKWKLLNQNDYKNKFGISQSDIYQLFAYGHLFKEKLRLNKNEVEKIKLYLIYPKSKDFDKVFTFQYKDKEKMELTICPFDIENDELKLDIFNQTNV